MNFYCSTMESVLTYCVTVWFAVCSAADRKTLQGVIKTEEKIIGCPSASLVDIPSSRCLNKVGHIIKDSTHPGHELFSLPPSRRRERSLKISFFYVMLYVFICSIFKFCCTICTMTIKTIYSIVVHFRLFYR